MRPRTYETARNPYWHGSRIPVSLFLYGILPLALAGLLLPSAAFAQAPPPAQSTTGPTPPPGVEPGYPDPQKANVTISGVPDYNWRHGCGPTAVGMVVGYWDGQGYDNLIPGSAATQTSAVNQAIASGGTSGSPNPPGSELHYEDYASPEDYYPTLVTDDYITKGRTAHTDDCIADFMDTSKSTRTNYYGWSWSSDIKTAWMSYVALRDSSYTPSCTEYYWSGTPGLTWSVLQTEIDANRPMVFLVDTDADGYTDHFVTVVGYRDTSGFNEYGCLDTWAPAGVRWETFAGLAQGNNWGIWGGWSFDLTQQNEPIEGVNFTVEMSAIGLTGTAVNNDPDPEDDVYKGGGGVNLLRLDGQTIALLGLVPGDDIDAISYGDPSLQVDLIEFEEPFGGRDIQGNPIFWHFSVDKFAIGKAQTGVLTETTTGTWRGYAPAGPSPAEAMGDYFAAEIVTAPGSNWLMGDEEDVGLLVDPSHLMDELNGLDLDAELIDEQELQAFQPGQFYFSLKAGSPSLITYNVHEADILTPDGHGGIKVAMPGDGVLTVNGDHITLGIPPDNDLDALFVDSAGIPFFSVDKMIPSAPTIAGPGDILVPDGVRQAPDGMADELIPAVMLGLLDMEHAGDPQDDNLDALDAELEEVPANTEPIAGTDQHATPVDTDGDGLLDADEIAIYNTDHLNADSDNDGLTDGAEVYTYPTDPKDFDSDDDGFWDGLEISAGTDPNNPASNLPFTPVYVDFAWTGPEYGSNAQPTSTMTDAIIQVSAGGTIRIKGNTGTTTTTETPRITKAMRIEVLNPTAAGVRIGVP